MILYIGRPGRLFVAGLVIYLLVLAAGIALLVTDSGPPSTAVGLAAALLSAVAAVLMLVDGPVRLRRQEGVERLVLHQATSMAFFASMAVAVTLGLLEIFTEMGPVSPWVLWVVGMSTWGVSTRILQRRIG